MTRRPATLALLGLALALPARAGTVRYVSTSGTGSYPQSTSASTPCSFETAWAGQQAGDRFLLRGGVYAITSRHVTPRAGRPGEEITWEPYPGESVTLDASGVAWGTSDGGSCPVVVEHDHHVFRGLTTLGGSSFFRVRENAPGTVAHVTFEGLTASGYNDVDNAGAVYIHAGTDHVTVRGCRITGPGAAAGSQNVAGIWVRDSTNLLVEGCEIEAAPIGVYYKMGALLTAPSGDVVRNNLIRGCPRGSMQLNMSHGEVSNNLIGPGCGPLQVRESNGGAGGHGNTIAHNTVLGGQLYLAWQDGVLATDNHIHDNLFLHEIWVGPWATDPAGVAGNVLDHNLYPPGYVALNRAVSYTLSAWRTAFGGSRDTHSSSGTPVFAGGPTPGTLAGFALAAGSPGHRAASDGTDVGCDVALVGVPGGDTTAPTCTITSPTSHDTHDSGSARTLTLGGTAAAGAGVTRVSWRSDRGGSGTATGTTSWTIPGIPLQPGRNAITVTAHDAAGHTGSDTITVTSTPRTSAIRRRLRSGRRG